MCVLIRLAGGDVAPPETWTIVLARGWDEEEGEPTGDIRLFGSFGSLLQALHAWRRWNEPTGEQGLLILLGPQGQLVQKKELTEETDGTVRMRA